MLAQENRHVFNVREYLALFEKGILLENPRTELINGEIIELSPLGNRHAKTQLLLLDFLRVVFAKSDVYLTGSLIANDVSMPEPDVYVLKSGVLIEDNYPKASQIDLVVEVGDSTIKSDLSNDGSGRLGMYAGANIPNAWVVDVAKKALYEFSEPIGDIYKHCLVHAGETELLGRKIDIGDLIASQ